MILDTIVEQKEREVNRLLASRYTMPAPLRPPRDFVGSLTGYEGVAIIAEVKKASPSKGIIRRDFDPARIAAGYEAGGAQAVSVLTDERFFHGALSYLQEVGRAVELPVLRKDFIIHPVQIEEARSAGADAVLLIAAILDSGQLKNLLAMTEKLAMAALVEVHDEEELQKALSAGSRLIGINNRNLKDFTVSLETTFRLRRLVPGEIPVVSESGICGSEDLQRLAEHDVSAALIGEYLMRAPDPGAALKRLRTGLS